MVSPLVAVASATLGAMATRFEGSGINASLSRGRSSRVVESCAAAEVVIITEEGTGRCFYYPFALRTDAYSRFDSISWRPTSRIMFACHAGMLAEEVRWGGHGMPYNTIRRAAKVLALFDKVFVQGDNLGMASYHFLSHQEAFISYEHEVCADWSLDDGSPLPCRKEFDAVSYDAETRTFRGTVSWAPSSFCGDVKWEHEMVFDETHSEIVSGQVYHYTPGVTDRSSPEQVLPYRSAQALESQDQASQHLMYRRWCPESDEEAALQRDGSVEVPTST